MKEKITDVLQGLKNKASSIWKRVRPAVGSAWSAVREWGGNAWSKIRGWIGGAWKALKKSGFGIWASGVLLKIKNSKTVKAFKDKLAQLRQKFTPNRPSENEEKAEAKSSSDSLEDDGLTTELTPFDRAMRILPFLPGLEPHQNMLLSAAGCLNGFLQCFFSPFFVS